MNYGAVMFVGKLVAEHIKGRLINLIYMSTTINVMAGTGEFWCYKIIFLTGGV